MTAELCTRPALVSKWRPADSAHSAAASHWPGGDNTGANRRESCPIKQTSGGAGTAPAAEPFLPRVPGELAGDEGVRCGWRALRGGRVRRSFRSKGSHWVSPLTAGPCAGRRTKTEPGNPRVCNPTCLWPLALLGWRQEGDVRSLGAATSSLSPLCSFPSRPKDNQCHGSWTSQVVCFLCVAASHPYQGRTAMLTGSLLNLQTSSF